MDPSVFAYSPWERGGLQRRKGGSPKMRKGVLSIVEVLLDSVHGEGFLLRQRGFVRRAE